MKLNGLQKISLNFHGISALGFIVNHRVSKDIHRCWVVHSEFLGRKFVVPLLTRPKGIRKHKNPLNMPRVLDKLLILVPGFCKHTTMVCFVCSYSVGFVGEWYHFSLFLPVFCFFLSYFFGVNSMGWHDSNQFPTPPQSHLKLRFFNQTPTRNFAAPSPEAKSPSLEGTRWIPAFWSLGFGWEKSWESVFALAVIFLDTEVTNGIFEVIKKKWHL